MTLRTTALIAGALGLLLLIGGLIADAMRPASFGTPRAAVDTAVVLVGPDMVATAPGGSVTFEGTGDVVAYVGRTEDVEAWASSRDVTVVTGIPDWEQLSVTRDDAMQPEASASPSASASPAASTSPSPSASPAESASPSPSAEPEVAPQIADIWRQTWDSNGSLELETVEISPGLTLVAESVDGSPLVAVQMTL
ncbi:hypothetical protein, partial [Demequina sp.]|uniref:hypothetical protein n=1 Tax=Demequina sp. TaxID=2050685 RepID=UPI0025FFA81A